MVKSLVNYGIWDKIQIFDYFSTHDVSSALVNWISPGIFNPTIVDNPSFNMYEGFTGGSGYLKSNFIPSIHGTKISQNNICMMGGIGNNLIEATIPFGATDSSTHLLLYPTYAATNEYGMYIHSSPHSVITHAGSKAYFTGSRGSDSTLSQYRNLIGGEGNKTSTGFISKELYICGRNNNGNYNSSNFQLRFALLSSYLTESEIFTTINIIESCLSTLGTGLI